jgi:uncharacterized protein (DUF2267 family)
MERRMLETPSRATMDGARIGERDLLDDVADAGFEDKSQAERAVCAAVSVLAERLTHDEASSIVRVLPEDLRAKVEPRRRRGGRGGDAAQLVERFREREGVSAGRAREEMQIVFGALGRRLSADERRAIVQKLPSEIAGDFEDEPDTPAPAVPLHPGPANTLASGRPGSQRPLSEAKPERAHSESVARTDDPHRNTKLSTSEGLTQEREGETLATAHPGPKGGGLGGGP